MSQPFLGEIRVFGFNFAPRGWIMCNGQTLSISQNAALFALIGTFYGGNGTSTFALPDFRSRVPIHQGNTYLIGQMEGAESVTLLTSNLPGHSHTLNAATTEANTQIASAAYLAEPARSGPAMYVDATPNVSLAATSIGSAGGSVPFDSHQPSLVLNFCIASAGVFPSRN